MKKENDYWKKENWYKPLSDKGKTIADLIYKNHDYFSKKDADYRLRVRVFKILTLLLATIGTIVFGLKTIIDENIQVVAGLIISALISFITAISSYFNLEVYWIRNIKTHIKLNILRDSFLLDVTGNSLDDDKINAYWDKLKDLGTENLIYWERNNNK